VGVKLTDKGADILRRGGHDDASDDDILLLELIRRMPGESPAGLGQVFVALREQYGEDALHALKSGHVKIEARK
jgi:hypothetical protein